MIIKQAYSVVLKEAVRLRNRDLIKVLSNSNVLDKNITESVFYDCCLRKEFENINFMLNEPNLRIRQNLSRILNDFDKMPKVDSSLDKVLVMLEQELN